MPDIYFSDDDSNDELMSKVRFIASNSPNSMKTKKKNTEKTAIIPKNSKGHPKITGKVPRKELTLLLVLFLHQII